jgi:hypothetical protein
MTTARYNHTATLLESGPGAGMVLVAGGATILGDAELSSAELFDGTSSFTATGPMTAPRENHTATFLASGTNAGKVLIAGGDDYEDGGLVATSGAELFDGVSSFAATGAMSTPRTNHTATLLPSGEVLVAGGESAFNVPLSSAELFLVASGGTCATGGQCASGLCDEGVCCAAPCPNSGVCQRCSLDAGACETVTGAPDPATCADASTCNASGQCVPVVEPVDAGEDAGAPGEDSGAVVAQDSGAASDDSGAPPSIPCNASNRCGTPPAGGTPDDDAGASNQTTQAKPSSGGGGGGCRSARAAPEHGGAATALVLLACAASLRARRRQRTTPLTPR